MAILVRNNFCIAPFNQITFSPAGNFSPCPEIGGRPWWSPDGNILKMWNSEDFKKLRSSFLNNEKNSICNRCWDQEELGQNSLRKRLLSARPPGNSNFGPGEMIPFLDHRHKIGPKQINIMVSNKCNLRCRSCGVRASSTYNIEGRYYQEKNNRISPRYFNEKLKPLEFSDDQIEQIFQLSGNVTRIEFYGGEPLLDTKTLSLLQQYVDSGLSKNITLYYNTNGIAEIKEIHYKLWSQFKSLEFKFSVDDIFDRFTYVRHPGKWNDWIDNLNAIRKYSWKIPTQVTAICTVGILNIYYIPELLDKMDELKMKVFLNTIDIPNYYSIKWLPTAIKTAIKEKLNQYHDRTKINFLLNYLDCDEDLSVWEDFKFWTKEKDEYRKENFSITYPEFYKIIKEYDPAFAY